MIRRLFAWWRARQRAIDLDILWPACKAHAMDLDQAKAVFAVHAFHDPAWLSLGDRAIIDFIEGLE
jgi:PIN domain nuclease of toxin-antitoxin system